jgi:hypothetical protein
MQKLWVSVMVVAVLIAAVLPVPAALAQEGVELTETFTSSSGQFSFNYPSGWVAAENFPGFTMLASDEAVLEWYDEEEDTMASDAVLMVIIDPSLVSMLSGGASMQPDTLEEFWDMQLESLAEDEEDLAFGEPEQVLIGDLPALRGSATSELWEGMLTLIDFDGSYVTILSMVASGTLSDHEELITSIFETMAYNGAVSDAPITFTSEDEALSLEYPGGWVAFEMMRIVIVSNNPGIMGWQGDTEAEPGMLVIYIYPPGVRQIEATTLIDAVTQYADITLPGEAIVLAAPEETTFQDHDAVRIDYQSELSQGYLLAVDYDGATLFIQVLPPSMNWPTRKRPPSRCWIPSSTPPPLNKLAL